MTKKYGINQINFDDMSFDNPEEADHYAKLENILWQSP